MTVVKIAVDKKVVAKHQLHKVMLVLILAKYVAINELVKQYKELLEFKV